MDRKVLELTVQHTVNCQLSVKLTDFSCRIEQLSLIQVKTPMDKPFLKTDRVLELETPMICL